MGRNPILQDTARKVLREANQPISFSEVRTRSIHLLDRRTLDSSSFTKALKRLEKLGEVEKILIGGRTLYRFVRQYTAQSHKAELLKIISQMNEHTIAEYLSSGFSTENIPRVAFVTPPQKEEDNIGIYQFPDWDSPYEAIFSIIWNDFLTLGKSTQEGIIKLLMWAYWAGIRATIEPFADTPSIVTRLEENKKYAQANLKIAKKNGDEQTAKAEDALIRILDVTLELVKKDNLAEFLSFGSKRRSLVAEATRTILANNEGWMNGGEHIFNNLVSLGEKAFLGFSEAGLAEEIQRFFPTHISSAFDLWDEFVYLGFQQYIEECRNISGNLNKAISQIRYFSSFLPSLSEVACKRKIAVAYLWNFPQIETEAQKSFKLPQFEDWLIALKQGNLDHRKWLFQEKTLNKLLAAHRRVKRGGEPLSIGIDKEPWKLRDLYIFHPRGKDPLFWSEIITLLRERSAIRRGVYKGGPVPKHIYEKFIEQESQYINKTLDKEERDVLKRSKKRHKSSLNIS